jgi:hypothetical protein
MHGARRNLRLALQTLAFGQAGYFTAAQAVDLGYSYQAQKHHVDNGNWLRIDRGLFHCPIGQPLPTISGCAGPSGAGAVAWSPTTRPRSSTISANWTRSASTSRSPTGSGHSMQQWSHMWPICLARTSSIGVPGGSRPRFALCWTLPRGPPPRSNSTQQSHLRLIRASRLCAGSAAVPTRLATVPGCDLSGPSELCTDNDRR